MNCYMKSSATPLKCASERGRWREVEGGGGRCGWFFVANNMQTLRLNEQRKLFKSLSQRWKGNDREIERDGPGEVTVKGGRSVFTFR